MGCFSLSCCASGMPIYDHDIYVMLIKRARDGNKEDISVEKNFVCSNNGACAYFMEASPFIAGKCDTYGNIEDINVDEGFRYTCNLLGIADTEFHNWVSHNWQEQPDQTGKNNDRYYLAFFRREVVDAILKYCYKYRYSLLGSSHQYWVLESFPEVFQYVCEVKNRYKYIYKIEDGRKLASDGRWIHPLEQPNYGIYKTSHLIKWINNPSISNKFMKCDRMKELLKTSTIEKELLNVKKEALREIELFGRESLWMRKEYYNTGIYPVDYEDSILKKIAETMMVTGYMFSINRFLWPSFSGPQHNDYKELRHLNKVVSKLIKKDLERYR